MRQPATPRRQRAKAGVFVAPFLSPSGRPVLVSTERDGCLRLIAEVRGVRGRCRIAGAAECVASRVADRGAPPLRARDFTPAGLLSHGVHWAPYRLSVPRSARTAPALIAIEERGRLVAEMAVTSAQGERLVRATLAALLEVKRRA